MGYTINEFKALMETNDIAFIYNGHQYYIFQGNNCCIVGDYADDASALTFDRFVSLNDNLEDTLDNWLVEGKPLKDILNDILLY